MFFGFKVALHSKCSMSGSLSSPTKALVSTSFLNLILTMKMKPKCDVIGPTGLSLQHKNHTAVEQLARQSELCCAAIQRLSHSAFTIARFNVAQMASPRRTQVGASTNETNIPELKQLSVSSQVPQARTRGRLGHGSSVSCAGRQRFVVQLID